MARRAFKRCVRAGQRKSRLVMRECRGDPGCRRMALRTVMVEIVGDMIRIINPRKRGLMTGVTVSCCSGEACSVA